MTSQRRAVILPVVLMVIVLLAVLGASFSFRIHADHASTQAIANRLQSRLAAEAGVEWVKLLLRTSRLEPGVWYHNPDAFNRVILWAYDEDSETAGTNDPLDEGMAYRFSIVADDLTDDEIYSRFGLTDEASRVNLNVATERQLQKLVAAAAGGDASVDVQEVVNAILDWRDQDNAPRSETGGSEGPYYEQLDKPYRVKNGPFDTVEELLLVKGVTANLLYGEDFDRNGLLTENEDDGNQSFPPDNEDGLLNQGLHAYLTVQSYETQVSNANKPRVNLLGDETALREVLTEAFPDEPEVVDFCVAASRPVTGSPGAGGAQDPGAANPGDPQTPAGANAGGGGQDAGNDDGGGVVPEGGVSLLPGESALFFSAGIEGDKRAAQSQRRPPDPPEEPDSGEGEPDAGAPDAPGEDPPPPAEAENPNAQQEASEDGGETAEDTGSNEEADPQTSDAPNPASPIRSPADLLFPRQIDGEVRESPVGESHLPVLMDRTTVLPGDAREVPGLININTAPRLVLECLDGLTSDQIEAILSERRALDDKKLSTTAWLVTEGIVDSQVYARIAPQITARAQQFRIQSLGFADHVGTVTRLEVIVDMNGPIAETISYRDISYLGGAFPIREEDREQQNAR